MGESVQQTAIREIKEVSHLLMRCKCDRNAVDSIDAASPHPAPPRPTPPPTPPHPPPHPIWW
jgi:hypothetical protein